MDDMSRTQVDLIREAFYYQSRFDGKTMVFKVDFPVMEQATFPLLVKDLALLSRTGIRVVVIPGAKERIDAVLSKYGLDTEWKDGVRVTSEDAIPFVKMAAFDVANRFMTELSAAGVHGIVGTFVKARGLGVVEGLDFRNTGSVDRIYVDPIRQILDQGMIPVFPCIGWSSAGKPYNLPSDEIALAACTALGAAKFFIISSDKGVSAGRHRVPEAVRSLEGGRVARLTPHEAQEILALNPEESRVPAADGSVGDGALEDLSLALRASRAGVPRVHIVEGAEEGVILRELFSNLGVGTMVYGDEYESIRLMKQADIGGVLRLMEPLMEKGILVRRDPANLEANIGDYVVYEVDGSIHACGALHDWGEEQAEIAGLATDPSCVDLGIGRRVVRYLIDAAEKKGFRRVFVLTTKTHDWFEGLGFKEVPVESLPTAKRKVYDEKRRSKAFGLELGTIDSFSRA